MIVTSIFMVAGGLAVYALLGIYIDDLSKQIKKRTNFIESLRTSLENADEKWKKLLDKIKKKT